MSMKLLVVTLKNSLKYSLILMTKSEIQNEKYKIYLWNFEDIAKSGYLSED